MTVSVGFLLAVCGVRLLIRDWLSKLSVSQATELFRDRYLTFEADLPLVADILDSCCNFVLWTVDEIVLDTARCCDAPVFIGFQWGGEDTTSQWEVRMQWEYEMRTRRGEANPDRGEHKVRTVRWGTSLFSLFFFPTIISSLAC